MGTPHQQLAFSFELISSEPQSFFPAILRLVSSQIFLSRSMSSGHGRVSSARVCARRFSGLLLTTYLDWSRLLAPASDHPNHLNDIPVTILS